MKNCDIIIPIYNAFDCLKPLIDSLIKYTDLKQNRVILINDKSTDDRVLPLLKNYANDNSIILLDNEKNLGFVGTVNRGMKYSNNDVLLLNSDTEVSPNWLKKIQECAYSAKNIGTVTPLSNNATNVSVPVGLTKNGLPTNMSFEEYSSLIEKIAYNEYPQVLSGHGFCLYIKRELINTIGFFDDKTFEKGYGEENDFCFRALDHGYINVICDNTIVYHKERQSFNEQKDKLVKNHLEILNNKYPIYMQRNNIWNTSLPINHICHNIEFGINLYNKKNILYIIHDWKDVKNNVGGTTLHAYDLIKGLNDKYNFFVLASENDAYKLYSYLNDKEIVVNLKGVNNYSLINSYNTDYKKMLADIIEGFNIGLVHVHHLIGHYFDIADVIKEKNIPAIITLHDYYCICPTINLLYNGKKYCLSENDYKCQECLKNKIGLNENIIKTWRNYWKDFLGKMDIIITPSNTAADIVNKIYNNIDIKVIEHGIDYQKSAYYPVLSSHKHNIGFIGVAGLHKGGEILEKLIKVLNKNITFHLFGFSELAFLNKKHKNYHIHGKYKRNELNDLIISNKIELICLFPIWPETYSYTFSEAISCNIPVLSFDIGAIAERIKKYNLGWVIPVGSTPKEISNKIDSILSNEKEYYDKIESIKEYKIKSTREMCDEYNGLYSLCHNIEDSQERINTRKKIIKDSFELKNTISSNEINWIFNSLKWKIVSKIKVPEFLKKIVRKFIRK